MLRWSSGAQEHNLELIHYKFLLHEDELFGRAEDMEVMDFSDDEFDTLLLGQKTVYSNTCVHGRGKLPSRELHAHSDDESEVQPNEHHKSGIPSNLAVIEAKTSGISFVLDPASCIH